MCDWTGINGHPLQYMPDAGKPDDGWRALHASDSGMFGTKGQPKEWLNTIDVSMDGETYQNIITEESVSEEQPYRSFSGLGDYQVVETIHLSMLGRS